jgi:hypothetical protein
MVKKHSEILAEAWAKCARFNADHQVGTKVKYRSLLDTETKYDLETVTRSEAWALPGGEAVVMIVGKSGGVSLDHIQVMS